MVLFLASWSFWWHFETTMVHVFPSTDSTMDLFPHVIGKNLLLTAYPIDIHWQYWSAWDFSELLKGWASSIRSGKQKRQLRHHLNLCFFFTTFQVWDQQKTSKNIKKHYISQIKSATGRGWKSLRMLTLVGSKFLVKKKLQSLTAETQTS